jgi:hypothetical protein
MCEHLFKWIHRNTTHTLFWLNILKLNEFFKYSGLPVYLEHKWSHSTDQTEIQDLYFLYTLTLLQFWSQKIAEL